LPQNYKDYFKKLMNKLLLFLLVVLLFVFTACENQSTLRNTAEDDGCYVKYGVIATLLTALLF